MDCTQRGRSAWWACFGGCRWRRSQTEGLVGLGYELCQATRVCVCVCVCVCARACAHVQLLKEGLLFFIPKPAFLPTSPKCIANVEKAWSTPPSTYSVRTL